MERIPTRRIFNLLDPPRYTRGGPLHSRIFISLDFRALDRATRIVYAWNSTFTLLATVMCCLFLTVCPLSKCSAQLANDNPGPLGTSQKAEIGIPLSDPKFPITAFAQNGSRRNQGAFEVVTLKGNAKITQGTFVATADVIEVWIDLNRADAPKIRDGEQDTETPPRKSIIEARGNCEVRIAADQLIRDEEWVGRLFSQFEIDFRPNVWIESPEPPPTLTPLRSNSNLSAAQQAIEWTPHDNQMHVQLATQLMALPSSPNANPGFPQSDRTLGQPGIIIGNPAMGGTVIDGGTMPMSNSALPRPGASLSIGPQAETVNAFQLGTPGPTLGSPPGATLAPAPISPPVAIAAPDQLGTNRIGAKEFRFSGRGSIPPQLQMQSRPERGDAVITITGGIRLKLAGTTMATATGVLDMGTVLIEADRAVIWTADLTKLLSGNIDSIPVEIYIEGNVVFQQGPRTIYADRMYYNAQSEYGMILGAEMLTPVEQYDGILRLKADVVQQRSRENFMAYQAALTSSRLGVPRYWLQSDRIELSDRRNQSNSSLFGIPLQRPVGDETGMKAKARHNFVYIEGFPIFYWPVLDTNIDTSSFYLSGVKIQNDQIFGNQVMLDWNLYQILGIQAFDGTKWTLSTDYLSKRGVALGTQFQYNVPNFVLGGTANGYLDVWGLRDKGLDVLGNDRNGLTPEEQNRGRALLKHKQYLSPDTELWAELGYISDRNFLEQYFEQEWDTQKDQSTALRLRQYLDNQMLDIWGQARVNPFFTETEWFPRLDHYWLGQPIGNYLTYYSHSDVGYGRMRVASTPVNAAEAAKFQLQNNEVSAAGLVAATRHEISLPIDIYYSKVVPFLSGEAAYWGEDINGDPISRLTGQAGYRSSTPIHRIFPDVQNSILNLNGLAHKVSFESQFLYADTTKDLNQLPLYNPIDDNAQEHFRRRLVFNTFGGVLPAQFDATQLAARQSLQRYVTASSTEVVTNQLQSRMGLHQRFQTKRGVPGRERIADVIEFDLDAIAFGNPDRDNFGQTIGGINYDFRYHIGDRVTLVSDGYYDLFENGLMATTLGAVINRPARGEIYTGITSLEGPISSTLVVASVNYRLNEKWATVGGATIDLNATGNIGQSIAVTRIGESFLFRLGLSVDYGRDNVSLQFGFEPRFLPTRGLGVVGGQAIGPAGRNGLE